MVTAYTQEKKETKDSKEESYFFKVLNKVYLLGLLFSLVTQPVFSSVSSKNDNPVNKVNAVLLDLLQKEQTPFQSAFLYAKKQETGAYEIILSMQYSCNEPIIPQKQFCSIFESVGYPKIDLELVMAIDKEEQLSFDTPCHSGAPICSRNVVYTGTIELENISRGYVAVWQHDLKKMPSSDPSMGEKGLSLSFVIDENVPEANFSMMLSMKPFLLCSEKGLDMDKMNIGAGIDSLSFSNEMNEISSSISERKVGIEFDPVINDPNMDMNFPIDEPPYILYEMTDKLYGQISLTQKEETIHIDATSSGDYLWSTELQRFKNNKQVNGIQIVFFTKAL